MKWLSFFLLLPSLLSAQLLDDFSSQNLDAWTGNKDKFFINANEQLQLNDTSQTSPAVLFRNFEMQANTLWSFYIQLDFSPSSSNFAKIILQADQTSAENFQGYFLRIGGISGNEDAIELFRQDGSNEVLLLSATAGAVGTSTVQSRLMIERDADGFWMLAVDYSGASNFVEEGSVMDNTYLNGSYFGLDYRYTSTRSDKFFFDDLKIDSQEDENAPILTTVAAISNNQVLLTFNEAILDNEAVKDVNNYQFDPSLNINNIRLNTENTILLEVTPILQNLRTYTLSIQNLSDLAGNTIEPISADFQYIEVAVALFGDVVFNEIMADPSPSIALPEIEYVELYNRSDKSVNLKDFVIADLSKEITLPDYLLNADDYVLIYKGSSEQFAGIDNLLALDDFVSLGNTGDNLQLFSPEGALIHQVSYTDDWYNNSSKDDGGWSLELTNPDAICEVSGSNWQASENGTGGTPGTQNSVLNEAVDNQFVGIERIAIIGDTQIRLFFAEVIDERIANEPNNYEIAGLNIRSATLEAPLFSSVLLELDAAIQKSTIYTLSLASNFSDCLGNTSSQTSSAQFALPDIAIPNDIIINEVLFNPSTGGSDFVELYNRSEKIIDIQSLIIADIDLENVENINTPFLLFPNEYVVLTESAVDILNRYETATRTKIIETDLPSFPDQSGSILIYRSDNLTDIVRIDEFEYSSDFHSALLDDENGVALERLNPNGLTQDRNNWYSAAAAFNFATPCVQNSQFFQSTNSIENAFQLAENIISPDEDGFQDLLLLEYQVDQVGYLANIKIFDSEGRPISTLAQSELIATNGIFRWDGTLENGTIARMGIYVLQVEYFTPQGTTRQEQFSFIVAKRL